jgi:hypothetical protein
MRLLIPETGSSDSGVCADSIEEMEVTVGGDKGRDKAW